MIIFVVIHTNIKHVVVVVAVVVGVAVQVCAPAGTTADALNQRVTVGGITDQSAAQLLFVCFVSVVLLWALFMYEYDDV